MPRFKARMIFDALLTVMLVFEMLHQLTGDDLHELVGFAFFACIVAHLLFSRKWIAHTVGALGSQGLSKRNKVLLVVALLLLVDVLVLAFSSVAISRTLWNLGLDLTGLNPGKLLYPVHTASAYILCVIVIVHLGTHWAQVARFVKIEYDPSRRKALEQVVNTAVAVGGVALGVLGAVQTAKTAQGKTVSKEDYLKAHSELEATGGSSTQNIGGYREKNAETGEFGDGTSFSVESVSGQGGAEHSRAEDEPAAQGKGSGNGHEGEICPLCPRQCDLGAPNCERPYEAGLI